MSVRRSRNGENLLETEIGKFGGNFKKLKKSGDIKRVARDNGLRKEEPLSGHCSRADDGAPACP